MSMVRHVTAEATDHVPTAEKEEEFKCEFKRLRFPIHCMVSVKIPQKKGSRRYREGAAAIPIGNNRADAVLFGLRLLYYAFSARAPCIRWFTLCEPSLIFF